MRNLMFLGLFILGTVLLSTPQDAVAGIDPERDTNVLKSQEAVEQLVIPTKFGRTKVETKKSQNILVKVVNAKGTVIVEKEVSLTEFLEINHKIQELPQDSHFILLYGNTAYYITE